MTDRGRDNEVTVGSGDGDGTTYDLLESAENSNVKVTRVYVEAQGTTTNAVLEVHDAQAGSQDADIDNSTLRKSIHVPGSTDFREVELDGRPIQQTAVLRTDGGQDADMEVYAEGEGDRSGIQ